MPLVMLKQDVDGCAKCGNLRQLYGTDLVDHMCRDCVEDAHWDAMDEQDSEQDSE
jgi:hypothetical protein